MITLRQQNLIAAYWMGLITIFEYPEAWRNLAEEDVRGHDKKDDVA